MYKAKYAALIDGYQMELVEEYEYFLRLTDHCDIAYLPDELMDFRYHAPLGRSLEIDSSPRTRREWRYRLQLARAEARQRRNIPPETTIIFPVMRDGAVETIEHLLDQVDHVNYRLLVVDLGLYPGLEGELAEIPDPRLSRISATEVSTVIRRVTREAQTPFIFLYDDASQLHGVDGLFQLSELHETLAREGVTNVLSTSRPAEATSFAPLTLAARLKHHASSLAHAFLPARGKSGAAAIPRAPFYYYRLRGSDRDPVFGELYRTEELRKSLKIRT
jgi:hypothetical protein